MRSVGRPCRGHGTVFVTLVRQTERPLCALGSAVAHWAQEATALLHQAPHLCEAQRERWRRDLEAASAAQRPITTPSHRLPHGNKLAQGTIV